MPLQTSGECYDIPICQYADTKEARGNAMSSPVKLPVRKGTAKDAARIKDLLQAMLSDVNIVPHGQTFLIYSASAFDVIDVLPTFRGNSHTGLLTVLAAKSMKNSGARPNRMELSLTGILKSSG